MGKGAGVKVDLDFILRLVELILLIIAVTFYSLLSSSELERSCETFKSNSEVIHALVISCCASLLLLVVMTGLQLIKRSSFDDTFVGSMSILGAVLLIITGLCICITSNETFQFSGGILAIVAAVVLVVVAMMTFHVIKCGQNI